MLGEFAGQGFASAFKKSLHPGDFGVVVGVGAAFEARGEAHLHLGIDAAWERRVGMEIVHAAAHFEKVERVASEFFGGGARGERAVVEIRNDVWGRASSPVLGPQGRWV